MGTINMTAACLLFRTAIASQTASFSVAAAATSVVQVGADISEVNSVTVTVTGTARNGQLRLRYC